MATKDERANDIPFWRTKCTASVNNIPLWDFLGEDEEPKWKVCFTTTSEIAKIVL